MKVVLWAAALVGVGVVVFVDSLLAVEATFLLASAVLATAFSILYLVRSRWRSTVPGRSLLYVSAAFAALAWHMSLRMWVSVLDHSATTNGGWLRVALGLILALAWVWQLGVLLSAQGPCPRRRKREDAVSGVS